MSVAVKKLKHADIALLSGPLGSAPETPMAGAASAI